VKELSVSRSDASIKRVVRRVAQALKAADKNPESGFDDDPDIEDCCKESIPKKTLEPMVRIVTPSGMVVYLSPEGLERAKPDGLSLSDHSGIVTQIESREK
jgi:hypothetical protein